MSNPYRLIKQFVLLTGLGMVAIATRAQQSYYICIQSENGQPFYTQIGDKVYSSSAVGHLIISGLKDNVCNLEIGFPQHTSRPQQFTVPIRGKDQGYQLKKNGSQDWALVSWQGQETIKPQKAPGSSDLLYGERKKDDAFAALMAAVVNDSAVLYTSIVKSDAPVAPTVAKTEEKQPVAETAVAGENTTPAKPLYDTTAAVAKVNTEKPLFDTTTAAKKPYVNEKPLYDTTMAKTSQPPVVPPPGAVIVYDTTVIETAQEPDDKPLYDTAALAKVPKNNTSIFDLSTGKPLYDTAVVNEVEEEPAAKVTAAVPKKEEKPAEVTAKPGVIKVQQTSKEGETKIVFIDSSESPADVVTVYINDEPVQPKTPTQPVLSDLATPAPKTEPEQKTGLDKKPDSVKKPDTVLKEEAAPAAKKEETKPVVSQAAPQVSEIRPVAEKPAAKKGDTLVIILESPQQKRDTAAKAVRQEAPKPLYAPRETTVTGAEKPEAEVETDKPAAVPEAGKTAEKPGKKGRAAKNADKKAEPPVQQEVAQPAKVDTTATKPETEVAKTPKAVYDPKPTELDKKVVMINSDCNRFATENDVDKLRVKMLNEKDVNKRMAAANKVFKSMCLTAKQIKALTELFPSDETKYRFLEMAYPFAADTGNFKQLFEVLSSENYQTKFKTLVRY